MLQIQKALFFIENHGLAIFLVCFVIFILSKSEIRIKYPRSKNQK